MCIQCSQCVLLSYCCLDTGNDSALQQRHKNVTYLTECRVLITHDGKISSESPPGWAPATSQPAAVMMLAAAEKVRTPAAGLGAPYKGARRRVLNQPTPAPPTALHQNNVISTHKINTCVKPSNMYANTAINQIYFNILACTIVPSPGIYKDFGRTGAERRPCALLTSKCNAGISDNIIHNCKENTILITYYSVGCIHMFAFNWHASMTILFNRSEKHTGKKLFKMCPLCPLFR